MFASVKTGAFDVKTSPLHRLVCSLDAHAEPELSEWAFVSCMNGVASFYTRLRTDSLPERNRAAVTGSLSPDVSPVACTGVVQLALCTNSLVYIRVLSTKVVE